MMTRPALILSMGFALILAGASHAFAEPRDYLAENSKQHFLKPGGEPALGSEFVLRRWRLPQQVRPGQQVRSEVIWETVRGNPNAMVFGTVIGDWNPDHPIAQLFRGYQGRAGTRVEREFSFDAPLQPGRYRIRLILPQAFAPITKFYSQPDGGPNRPGNASWSQAEFEVVRDPKRGAYSDTILGRRDFDGELPPPPAPRPDAEADKSAGTAASRNSPSVDSSTRSMSGAAAQRADAGISGLGEGAASGLRGMATWYAGRWDSHLYNLSQHPHTVAVRVDVEDAATGLPLSGAIVTLEGKYNEDIGLGDTVERQVRFTAVTGTDGVAVFGLLWHKVALNQMGVDDIEKVQRLIVRRDGYRFESRRVDLKFLTEDPDDGWVGLVAGTQGAKYFVLRPGPKFDGYNDKSSQAEVFFRKVRIEDYDELFAAKENNERDFPRHFFVTNPQIEAGPFMMLPASIRLERLFQEQRIDIGDDRKSWIDDQRPRNDGDSERRPPKNQTVVDGELPPGHLHIEDIKRIDSIINTSMTKEQIVERLGEPSRSWTSPSGNKCYSWQGFENSRWGVLVVIEPNGRVLSVAGQR